MEAILAYCLTLISLVSLDAIWLNLIAKHFYTSRLGFLFSPSITWWPLFIFYPLFAAGIFFFAVHPSLSPNLPLKAFFLGAFLGLLAYAAYDLTNQATIASWPVIVTIIDILWGAVLAGATSAIAVILARIFGISS
jgi:uncharacterized membrane protein